MHLPRSSGILLHPTSLPGGRLGDAAYRFVDWLAAAGQSWWQILPLGPPDEEGSPYKAASAFAAWHGLLAEPDAPVSAQELEDFVARHPFWIGGWAAFAGKGSIADQVRFEREWSALRGYGRERGIRLIGDLPIYVAEGGADHQSQPELFQEGLVGGVPPDAFTKTGQLWGNPVYDWAMLRAQGFRWWVERFRRTFELVDVTRLDHFRGLVAYWAVPEDAKDARPGSWRRGPGRALFDAAAAELGDLPLIAEDLGVITPPVEALRDGLGLPGMRVLQFVLPAPPGRDWPPPDAEHQVVYPGTHDNDTAVGWWDALTAAERRNAERRGVDPGDPAWSLLRQAYASRARLAVVPLQDVLRLGTEARMNTPGRAQGNWTWRLEGSELTEELAAELRAEAEAAERLPAVASRR
jgi:4-alpha-glucanotransferase